jgi:hypothetical protein
MVTFIFCLNGVGRDYRMPDTRLQTHPDRHWRGMSLALEMTGKNEEMHEV